VNVQGKYNSIFRLIINAAKAKHAAGQKCNFTISSKSQICLQFNTVLQNTRKDKRNKFPISVQLL